MEPANARHRRALLRVRAALEEPGDLVEPVRAQELFGLGNNGDRVAGVADFVYDPLSADPMRQARPIGLASSA